MTIFGGFGFVLTGLSLHLAVFAANDQSALASTTLGGWPSVPEPSFQAAEYEGLAAQLSADAVVYYQNSTGFTNATTRWSVGYNPKPTVVVVPATEDDVAATVNGTLSYTFQRSSILQCGLLI